MELNLSKLAELEGIHDIYQPEDPPYRKAIPINKPGDRIGTPYIPVNEDKIVAVVLTDIEYNLNLEIYQDKISDKIADYIIEFLKNEIESDRLPPGLLPLQSGVGAVANAVLSGLGK